MKSSKFALAALAGCLLLPLISARADAADSNPYAVGARMGPFIVTAKTLTELVNDGYEIRGNMGTALILQKQASIFSCSIPPDPERLSYKPYFVCSELREDHKKEAGKSGTK